MKAKKGTVVYFGTTGKGSGHGATVLSGSFENIHEQREFERWLDGLSNRSDLRGYWPKRSTFATINFECGTWFGVNLSPHDDRPGSKTVLFVFGESLSEQQMVKMVKKFPFASRMFDQVCAKYSLTMPKEKLDGSELIANERQRQIDMEGYDAGHDGKHSYKDLLMAACTYLHLAVIASDEGLKDDSMLVEKLKALGLSDWPWEEDTLKPSRDIKRMIVKGCSLGAAAIDRLIMDEKD